MANYILWFHYFCISFSDGGKKNITSVLEVLYYIVRAYCTTMLHCMLLHGLTEACPIRVFTVIAIQWHQQAELKQLANENRICQILVTLAIRPCRVYAFTRLLVTSSPRVHSLPV